MQLEKKKKKGTFVNLSTKRSFNQKDRARMCGVRTLAYVESFFLILHKLCRISLSFDWFTAHKYQHDKNLIEIESYQIKALLPSGWITTANIEVAIKANNKLLVMIIDACLLIT